MEKANIWCFSKKCNSSAIREGQTDAYASINQSALPLWLNCYKKVVQKVVHSCGGCSQYIMIKYKCKVEFNKNKRKNIFLRV